MKIYLVSNNSLLDNISYQNDANLEIVRMIRPLSIEGLNNAKKICNLKELQNAEKIYSSFYSSALSTATFLSKKLELDIILDNKFDDCKVGILGSKNMKMVKGLQDHDFNYRLANGESLNEVGERIFKAIKELIKKDEEAVVFTHKRAISGFLTKYAKVGYNLDDNLILEYNNKIVYDDSDTDIDIYELTIEDNQIIDINIIQI